MQLTQRAKLVDRRPMTALEKIYLWNIAKGMWITIVRDPDGNLIELVGPKK